ncbi:MAG TPA: hypothetical protein VK698_13855 [Kofleriaceae bacterium]|nr:hypothetical protein [Kofleriaceae bacterium]
MTVMDLAGTTWIDVSLLAALAATVVGCAPGAGARPAAFAPRQVSRVYTQTLAAPADQILPLLTPLGEKAWAHGWDPAMRFEAAPPGDGTLFATRHPGEPDTIWLLETFDAPGRHVRYLHVTPGSDVTEIDIQLRQVGADRTEAVVRYTYTGFSERGNALVESRTEDYYRHFMIEWERELNDHLSRLSREPG